MNIDITLPKNEEIEYPEFRTVRDGGSVLFEFNKKRYMIRGGIACESLGMIGAPVYDTVMGRLSVSEQDCNELAVNCITWAKKTENEYHRKMLNLCADRCKDYVTCYEPRNIE